MTWVFVKFDMPCRNPLCRPLLWTQPWERACAQVCPPQDGAGVGWAVVWGGVVWCGVVWGGVGWCGVVWGGVGSGVGGLGWFWVGWGGMGSGVGGLGWFNWDGLGWFGMVWGGVRWHGVE